jgi:superfamily I DNA/RNA helicase
MRNHVLTATGRTPRPLNDFEMKVLEADLKDNHGGLRNVRAKIKAYESAWARLQHEQPGHAQSPEDAAFEADLLAWLNFHRAMLIGEVIPQFYQYLFTNPAANERSEYTHILIDEYQDLNKAEQGVIALMADEAEVCIVGDDDQSIYSFKNAHPEGIREWAAEHQDAADLGLIECRRSPSTVVEMANSLISCNQNRPEPRQLQPMEQNGDGVVRIIQYATLDQELQGVVTMVSEMVADGVAPGDILVLAQRKVVGTPIYEGLKGNNVAVRSYYAESELDAEETQRRFALLKLFVGREDRVALRWLLGRGSNTWLSRCYKRIRDYCSDNDTTPWATLDETVNGNLNIPYTTSLLDRFRGIKDEIEELEETFNELGLTGVIDLLFPEGDEGVRDIRELARDLINENDELGKTAFLRELTSLITTPEIPTEIEDVRIMSLHKSKGLSAPVTIVAGCVEGLLPMRPHESLTDTQKAAHLEEQRRLFYVGISRVKAAPNDGKPGTLVLTYSQEMPLATAMGAGISPAGKTYGNAVLLASRFIGELGDSAPNPVAG